MEKYLEQMGVKMDVFKLNGSIGLAPKIGIADAIVDIVETGNTLKADGLVETEKIMDVSTIFKVNRISQKKTNFEKINQEFYNIKDIQ